MIGRYSSHFLTILERVPLVINTILSPLYLKILFIYIVAGVGCYSYYDHQCIKRDKEMKIELKMQGANQCLPCKDRKNVFHFVFLYILKSSTMQHNGKSAFSKFILYYTFSIVRCAKVKGLHPEHPFLKVPLVKYDIFLIFYFNLDNLSNIYFIFRNGFCSLLSQLLCSLIFVPPSFKVES